MKKLKFTALGDVTQHNNVESIEMNIDMEHVAWTDLLDDYISFLRCCGYSIPDDWMGEE
jgi:hypothetical protein